MRKLHMGYGCISNMNLHEELMNMDTDERMQLELKLKEEDERMYNSFKEWQKSYIKRFPNKKDLLIKINEYII